MCKLPYEVYQSHHVYHNRQSQCPFNLVEPSLDMFFQTFGCQPTWRLEDYIVNTIPGNPFHEELAMQGL